MEQKYMNTSFEKWDAVEFLKTEEDMVEYLKACIEEAGDNPKFITKALNTIARTRVMTMMVHNTAPPIRK